MKLDQNTTTVHIFRTGNLLLSQDLGPSRDQWLSFFSILPQTLVGRICTWPFNRVTSPAINFLAKGTSSPAYTTLRISFLEVHREGQHSLREIEYSDHRPLPTNPDLSPTQTPSVKMPSFGPEPDH